MDEAGISAGEPTVVAGGILMPLNATMQTRVRAKINTIIEAACGQRPVAQFHATDVFHGTKAFSGWNVQERKRLMVRMAMVPREFGLVVFAGNTNKLATSYNREGPKDRITNDEFNYSLAFGIAVAHAQSIMERFANGTHCELIVEDCPNLRKWASFAFDLLDGGKMSWPKDSPIPFPGPLKHLLKPRFVPKTDEALLQLADLVVFILRRLLNEKKDARELFSLFEDQLYVPPHQEAPSLPVSGKPISFGPVQRSTSLNETSALPLLRK